MDLAEKADIARAQGDEHAARSFLKRAYEKELSAAKLGVERDAPEPTRSILLKSAAHLAVACNDLRFAEQLVTKALSGDPPDEIAEELRSLLKEVRFVPIAATPRKLTDFQAAKKEWSQKLFRPGATGIQADRSPARRMAAPDEWNIVGVGLGEKITDNRSTGAHAVKFFVQVKYPENQVPKKHLLPRFVNGLPTDVEQVGVFHKFVKSLAKTSRRKVPAAPAAIQMPDPRARIRPAQPGCSVGFQDPTGQFVMAGTFGALVKDDNGLYILSSNHVLADEDKLKPGAPIFQPGLLDGGNANTVQIAELTRAIQLQLNAPNCVDCAVAKVLKASLVNRAILYIGNPAGTAAAAIDMVVHKFGRTTGYQAGRVTSIDTDVTVSYDAGRIMFQSQIIIVGLNGQSFGDAGDSGSLILERASQNAVALLLGGSASHTIANHIGDVFQALNVTLA